MNILFKIERVISISTYVQNWVDAHPFLRQQLKRGIVNHSALAREMKPEIEHLYGEKISIESITIALNRAGKNLAEKKIIDPISYLGDISIQTGLDILVYEISDFDKMKLPDIETRQQGYFLSVRGIWHASIITTAEIAAELALSKKAIEDQKNITATTIRLKPRNESIPGVTAGILSVLANKGVSLQEVISTHNELTIMADSVNAELAMKTLLAAKNAPRNFY